MSNIAYGQIYRSVSNPKKFIRIEHKKEALWDYEWANDLDKIDGRVNWYDSKTDRTIGMSEWEILNHYTLFNVKPYCAYSSTRVGSVYYSRKAVNDTHVRVPPHIVESLFLADSIPFVDSRGRKEDDFNI